MWRTTAINRPQTNVQATCSTSTFKTCVCVCTYRCVGHGVVPPEGPGGGEVSDHHVDAVVLMGDEDADDSRGTEQPAEPAIPPHPPGRV